MMINILKSIKNNFLVIISFTLLIIFIWLRILAERLPREIPFNLSTVSIIIIICIIFGHFITITSLSNYTKIVWENKYTFKFNILDLNRVIDTVVESIFRFRRAYGKKLGFNLNIFYDFFDTKIIPNVNNKTKYNYVINYIKVEILIRILLSIVFIIDIFYNNKLYYYYYILILLSLFLLVHLFIKNGLKGIVNNCRVNLKNELKISKVIAVDELGYEKAVNFETGEFGFLTWDHAKFIPYPIINFEDLIESQTRQHLLKQPLIDYMLSNVNKPGIDLGVAKSMLNFAMLCYAAFIHIEIRKKNYIYWLIGLHLVQGLCWTYILVYSSFNIDENLFILGILPECFDINLFL